ncbi:MAG: HD domain-containing protein [Coleofasciculaceae cyanobacterium SM2_1_6]|nr:HD domain-containing protein [Coleofasciculaceae cyanobacterium SM2_1_6]
MIDPKLAQQLQFIVEIDKLKNILRQNLITDASRRENSAEHSWHLAMMAIVLAEYAPPGVDLLRVIKMLLVHDLVEIDAGDTFCYDAQGNEDKNLRELQAADRLFGLLPPAQAPEIRAIWDEFEAQQTADAQFATVLDRLQPFLQNQQTQGGTWRIHNITPQQIKKRMAPIQAFAPALWQVIETGLQSSIQAGYITEPDAMSIPTPELIPVI